MKYLVVSDAHGNVELMQELVKENPGVEGYLDAGDSMSDSYSIQPFRSVKGNCDYFPFDEKALIRNRGGNIFMRHLPYISLAESQDVKVFIHGHTHRYKIEQKDNFIILCPGALSRPRDDSNGSYAILTIEEGKINIDIIDVFTKKILLNYYLR